MPFENRHGVLTCTNCECRAPGELGHGPPCACGDPSPRQEALKHASILHEVGKDFPGLQPEVDAAVAEQVKRAVDPQMGARIEVEIDEKGYTLFTISGRNVLAYQRLKGVHHLIPTEAPAQSYTSGLMASKAICSCLKREGGDVLEFIKRPQNTFQLPS